MRPISWSMGLLMPCSSCRQGKETSKVVGGRDGSLHSGLSILRLYLCQTTSPKSLAPLSQNGGTSEVS